jgi:general secretion pathway protein D
MAISKPNPPKRRNAAITAACCLVLVSQAFGQPAKNLATVEQNRRSAAISEAQELLRKGDQAYEAARYNDAVEAYAGARELIPNAPISAELRAAATERYAQASVEKARGLSRKGDVVGAKTAVDKVLAEDVAPKNVDALAFRAQLDDPIRTNPALTKEHAKDIDAVRRLLYTAQGAYDLGNYDAAKTSYERVIRIDPNNSAARRGLEQIAGGKSSYFRAAYDHTRAEMLSQVAAQWETQVPATDLDLSPLNASNNLDDANTISVASKLDRIIIPTVALDQVSLAEALDFLRVRAAENDTLETDPTRKGVNFTVNLGAPNSPAAQKINALRFNLQLSQVPLAGVLKYLTELTQTTYTVDDFSVIISAIGTASEEFVTRTYRVPPDFISNLSTGAGGTDTAKTSASPFDDAPATTGLITVRLSAQAALAKQGVAFPPGASASYTPATNTLRVVNSVINQDFVAQIVESVTKTEPVMVIVRVTMIETQKTNLTELGFDWILDSTGNSLSFGGGTRGNGGNLSDLAAGSGPLKSPITAGNHSGNEAISGNAIDAQIGNSFGGRQETQRAPRIFDLKGAIDNRSAELLVRGLNQKRGTDLLASPSVTTRSGQASSIQVVREFMYATEYEPPQLPNDTSGTEGTSSITTFSGGVVTGFARSVPQPSVAVTPANPSAFKKRDVGVTLDVLPVADPDKNFIDVTITPTITDFDGYVNYGSPINTSRSGPFGSVKLELTANRILMPVFSKKSINTTIRIADGATIVIGGLLRENVQNVEDKTPILGDIPIVGRLFQSQARQSISTAIVFLVNVELIDPTGRPYRKK